MQKKEKKMKKPMKKPWSDMTFQEFFELAKDEETKQLWLEVLKKDGFTDEQINGMKMMKALDVLTNLFARTTELYEYALFKALEKKTLTPKDIQGSQQVLKSTEELIKLLEEEKQRLIKEKEKRQKKE